MCDVILYAFVPVHGVYVSVNFCLCRCICNAKCDFPASLGFSCLVSSSVAALWILENNVRYLLISLEINTGELG